jgi:hypothetical protein
MLAAALGLAQQAPVRGADEGSASGMPPHLDLVPRDTAMVFSMRLGEFWHSQAARGLREQLARPGGGLHEVEDATGLSVGDVQRLTVVIPTIDRNGPSAPLFFVTTDKPYDRDRVLKAFKAQSPGANRFRGRPPAEAGVEKRASDTPYYVLGDNGHALLYLCDDHNLVFAVRDDLRGSDPALALLGQLLRRARRGPLGDALTRAGPRHTALACVNVAEAVRALPEPLPLEFHPFLPLLKAETATATLDVADTTRLNVQLQFDAADAARKAAPRAQALIALGCKLLPVLRRELARDAGEDSPHMARLLDQAEAAMKDAVVHTRGDRVEVEFEVKTETVLVPALIAMNTRIRGLGDRTQSLNNLRQMALAFHNYMAAYGHFPPAAICDAAGKPLLSWRVAILPFVEQDHLYKQFKLDEPWDSEHNKKLLDKMPKIYALPGVRIKGSGLTAYQLFVGKDALFDGGKKPRIADIPDGTSNTVLIAEAAEPVPWTRPVDIPFDNKDPRSRVGGWYGDAVNIALCDGSVRMIHRKKITRETFRNAIMPADGNVLGPDW